MSITKKGKSRSTSAAPTKLRILKKDSFLVGPW
jgi:hypothetical protein